MKDRLDPLTLPLRGCRLIEASAGTGKTWTIAALYLRLVLGHGDDGSPFGRSLTPPEILVMTFTVAATRDLSDRIRSRLVDAARGFRDPPTIDPDDALLHALVAAHPGDARAHAAWRLATAAEAMDDAAVFTIDAWVQRMLREHAFDSGSLFDEEVQPDDEVLFIEAARDYWRQQVYPLVGDALDQVLAVWPTADALTADVRRWMRLVGRGQADGQADDKMDDGAADDGAADESLGAVLGRANAERLDALAVIKGGWATRTLAMRAWLHAQCASPAVNRQKLQKKRLDGWLDCVDRWARDPRQVASGLTSAARHRLSAAGLREAFEPHEAPLVPPDFDALDAAFDAVERLADPAHALRRHAAARVAAQLRTLKQRAGTYGFDDMLERLDAALAGPSGTRLRERIVAQYPVALIDEFQDTSPLQYRIFDRLYRIAADQRDTALLLIGDPKQSIYGFRGADIHSYLAARAAIAGRPYLLTTNHRSTAPLVKAVNHLFAQADARGDGAFRFGPKGTSPLPFVAVAAKGRRATLHDAGGPVAAMTLCHDAELGTRDEARHRFADRCAEHIATSLDDPQAGFVDPLDGFSHLRPADITVLVRDRHEAAAIRRALQRRGIASVYLSDQDSVFGGPEARDLLHWLRAVADPLDSRRARVAFATTLVDLPLSGIARLSRDDLAFEARLDDLKTLSETWRRLGVLPMLRRTLHLLDLPARWLARPDGERRLTNLLHLAELLQAASAGLDGEQAVIRWLADQIRQPGARADEQVVRLESDADLVRVVTIHKAKGLEYPIVYLPFVCSFRDKRLNAGDVVVRSDDDGGRTIVFDIDDDDRRVAELAQQQEDVRLLYVALTRARDALWLGIAPLTWGNSRQCAFHRSAFGYLLTGGTAIDEGAIAGRLHETFGRLAGVRLAPIDETPRQTRLKLETRLPPLVDAPHYTARFERDWSIGSFSGFVRDLARVPIGAVTVEPAVEEELLSDLEGEGEAEGDEEAPPPSNVPRHRFPRGAVAGNFLHDQLEWLAEQRFALQEAGVREQLARRCDRQGWGRHAADVVAWLGEVAGTRLPPLGVALDALPRVFPEMEFWFPSERLDAHRLDQLCRRYLLDGRERPALPERILRGLLLGFADLVFEVDGRYWVLDYKSNVLGPGDDAYTRDALTASMAAHRYDVQAAIYLLALHRLLRQRLGERYDPATQLGGALYLFMRGIRGPCAGCHVVAADPSLIDALDHAFAEDALR